MSDIDASNFLTVQALTRLRALAKGNGINPDDIVLTTSDEQIYTLEGVTRLEPFTEQEDKRYLGPVSSKGVEIVANFEVLRAEAEKRQNIFRGKADWIRDAQAELRQAQGGGWGLDGARITFPDRTVTLAANEACPQCKGQKSITCQHCLGLGLEMCTQCQGARRELCYNCHGIGTNPANQKEACPICHAQRYIQCRVCFGSGQMQCSICYGKRGIPCAACGAKGQMSEEIRIHFGAVTHFELKASGLPSGMRKGLDRLGIANLPKGHANVEVIEPKKEEEENDVEEQEEADYSGFIHPRQQEGPPGSEKKPDPTLHYRAVLPFADLRIDFKVKKAAVGVFGKRAVFIDVPPFLDETLKPWREKLVLARNGKGPLHDALEARAIGEALNLNLQRKGTVQELRKIYPVGLSPKTAEEILWGTRRALKHVTRGARIGGAVGGVVLSAALFWACYLTSLPMMLAKAPHWAADALTFGPPVIGAGLGWLLTNAAIYFDLNRLFRDSKRHFFQNTGMIGYLMIAAIIVLWAVILGMSPLHPAWLPALPLHK